MTVMKSNQKGVSLIAAIFIIVILAFMGVMFVSLISTSSLSSVNDLQTTQALYVAEGGLEYALANQTFPDYVVAATLGAGNFTITAPSSLNGAITAATNPIVVNATPLASFPGAGRIVIDSELIDYTSWNGLQFGGPVTRGVGGTTAAAHNNGAAVYPVATLTADPGPGATITVNANSTTGFLIPGVIKIDEEYIYCAGPVTATTFPNCTRGYKGSAQDAHPIGRNVFQYMLTATGTVNNATRQVKRAVAGTGNSFYKGWFAKNGAVGNQIIGGVGFRPTAVIFYWTRQTATGFATNESLGFGFASDATQQRSIAIESDDNAGSSNYSRIRSDTSVILMLLAPAGGGGTSTLMARANLVSLDADGFTINWVLNENRADIIHFIALGGDVTDAFAGSFASNRTTNGNQAVAGVGFRPDFVMFLSTFTEAVSTAPAIAATAAKLFNLGFMTSAGQGSISICGRDNQNNNTNAYSWQLTTRAILGMTTTCTEDSQASFSSMDADGFTINWNNAPAALGRPFFFLALKGGQYDVGAFNQPNATGNQTIAGFGFQSNGFFMASANRVAIANRLNTIPSEISIGAADSSANQGATWSEARNIDSSDTNMATLTDRVFRMATGTGGGVPTINAEANFVRFNSDSFTVNWTIADATARQILYWAVGPNVARSGTDITPVNLDWREVYP